MKSILVKVTRIAGVMVVEGRPLSDLDDIEKAFDFQGKTLRMVVLPVHVTLTREEAYEWAKRCAEHYAKEPFLEYRCVEFKDYSHANAPFHKGLKAAYDRTHKVKPKKKKDRGSLDVSTEGD
jgi:hypothetical protein